MNASPFLATAYADTASLVHEEHRNLRGRVVRKSLMTRETAYAVREVIVLTLSKSHTNTLRVILA